MLYRDRLADRALACFAAALAVLVPAAAPAAQQLTTLYAFKGGTDGAVPQGGVVFGPDGLIYGTTQYGGAYGNHFAPGGGTIFQLAAGSGGVWNETILANFFGPTQGQNCSMPVLPNRGVAGFGPVAPPTFDPSGNLYVPAVSSGCDEGTVVELSHSGYAIENVLQFQLGYPMRQNTRGNSPYDLGGLITDSNGYVYGTTAGDGEYQLGEVFRLAPGLTNNVVTLLYSFPQNDSRGDAPVTGVIEGPGPVLYGTTSGGFKGGQKVLRFASTAVSVLHSFSPEITGGPGTLILEGSTLYGTTYSGGTLPGGGGGQGVVYQLTPSAGTGWTYTVLHTFGAGTDGAHPGQIVFGPDGAIYGNARNGGRDGVSGVIFRLAPPAHAGGAWVETIPWYFTGGTDGANPDGKLVIQDDTLYGATIGSGAGPAPYGTVFKLVR
jgi:hypothetical protein